MRMTEAVALRFSVKKVFLKISLNSLEKICAKVSILIKLKAEAFCFPVNFAKFLRTPISKEDLWWLPLEWNTQKEPKKWFHKFISFLWKGLAFFFFFLVYLLVFVFTEEIAFKHFLFINITKFRFFLRWHRHWKVKVFYRSWRLYNSFF